MFDYDLGKVVYKYQAQYLFLIIKVGWMVGCKASIVLFMARRHSSMDWSAPLIM